MEMKKMIVGFLLVATYALPPLHATLEKDFISPEAINMVLKKLSSNAMLDEQALAALTGKILVSNPIIEEALLQHSNLNGPLGGSWPCGESCVYIPCITSIAGCECSKNVCYKNSLAVN
uniref:Cyclotide n=1 Tax=Viola tricolor TaxID=214053 RepID=A0A0N7H9Z1_9ROSI|nr:cyclotide precursor [Viola tricolor]